MSWSNLIITVSAVLRRLSLLNDVSTILEMRNVICRYSVSEVIALTMPNCHRVCVCVRAEEWVVVLFYAVVDCGKGVQKWCWKWLWVRSYEAVFIQKKKQFAVHIRLLIMRVDNFRRSLVSRFQGPLLYPSSLLSKSRTSFCSEYHAYQFTYSAVLLRARVHANNRYWIIECQQAIIERRMRKTSLSNHWMTKAIIKWQTDIIARQEVTIGWHGYVITNLMSDLNNRMCTANCFFDIKTAS